VILPCASLFLFSLDLRFGLPSAPPRMGQPRATGLRRVRTIFKFSRVKLRFHFA